MEQNRREIDRDRLALAAQVNRLAREVSPNLPNFLRVVPINYCLFFLGSLGEAAWSRAAYLPPCHLDFRRLYSRRTYDSLPSFCT